MERGSDVQAVSGLDPDLVYGVAGSLQELSEVFVSAAALVAVVLVDHLSRRLAAANATCPVTGTLFVHIADGEYSGSLVPEELAHPVRPVVSRPDESDGHLVAGSVFPEDRGWNDGRHGERRSRGGLQKRTTVHSA